MTKDDLFLEFPEWECVEHGDPFLTKIVQLDDLIDDRVFNWEILGLDEIEARREAYEFEYCRLRFEIETLDRWILIGGR